MSVKLLEMSKLIDENLNSGIKAILNELRVMITTHLKYEDEQRKIFNNKQKQNKQKMTGTNAIFVKLGFPGNMFYGQKSDLRRTFSRFLRFAYLID